MGPDDRCEYQRASIRGRRRVASNAEAEERSHHQPRFRFRDQSVCARRDCLLAHEVRRARIDLRAPERLALQKYPLPDDLLRSDSYRTTGRQFGLSVQTEIA